MSCTVLTRPRLAGLAVAGLLCGGLAGVAGLTAPADAVPGFAFERIAGPDRFATSALVAEAAEASGHVVLANGQVGQYADALSATHLAGALDAPVLLTRRAETPPVVLDQLEEAGVEHITVVGGGSRVSEAQVVALTAAGFDVERVAGEDRYATSAAVIAAATESGAPESTGLVATGTDFADALAAGPLAERGHPLALAAPDGVDGAVLDALTDAGVDSALVLGGEAALGAEVVEDLETGGIEVVERLAGEDRTGTAVAVATYGIEQLGLTDTAVNLASGEDAGGGADALSGGVLTGQQGRPLLIMPGRNELGGDVVAFLEAHDTTLTEGIIFGGTAVVGDDLRALYDEAAQGEATPEPEPDPTPRPPRPPRPPVERGSALSLVSIDGSGAESAEPHTHPSVSEGGEVVTMSLENCASLGRIWQREHGTTTRMAVLSNGSERSIADGAVVSADGSSIAFATSAAMGPEDLLGFSDIFVRTTGSPEATRVSVNDDGNGLGGHSLNPSISADGGLVVFSSTARLSPLDQDNELDIYLRDRRTSTTRLVSTWGSEFVEGGSDYPSISPNGRYVAFASFSRNSHDEDDGGPEVYVVDLNDPRPELVSATPLVHGGNSGSHDPAVSDNGVVTFWSEATDLVTTPEVTTSNRKVYVRDTQAGSPTTSLVSVQADGQAPAEGWSLYPSISRNGSVVAFESEANGLLAGDEDQTWDVFVRYLDDAVTRKVSAPVGTSNTQGAGGASISSDGRWVAFATRAALLSADTDAVDDVYLADLETPPARGRAQAAASPRGAAASSAEVSASRC